MTITNLYLIGTHHYGFRPGVPARVIGYKMLTPDNPLGKQRHVFEIQFEDGAVDHVAVEDKSNYKLLTLEQIQLAENKL